MAATTTRQLVTMEKRQQLPQRQQQLQHDGPDRQDDPMELLRSEERRSRHQQHSRTTPTPRRRWTRVGTGFGMECPATNNNSHNNSVVGAPRKRSAVVPSFPPSAAKLLVILAVVATAAGTTYPHSKSSKSSSTTTTTTGPSQSVTQTQNTVDCDVVVVEPTIPEDLPNIEFGNDLDLDDGVDCDSDDGLISDCCINTSHRLQHIFQDVDGDSFCDYCGDIDGNSSRKQIQNREEEAFQDDDELTGTNTKTNEEKTNKTKKTPRQAREDREIIICGFFFTVTAVATSLVAHFV